MPPEYARGTKVPVERTKSDLEKLLGSHGATEFGYATSGLTSAIAFKLAGRLYKISIPLPDPADPAFDVQTRGAVKPRKRGPAERQEAVDAELRRVWRALYLVIHAKLQAVREGIRTVEEEFLGDSVTADGRTVREWLAPQLTALYKTGNVPALMPGLEEGTWKRK